MENHDINPTEQYDPLGRDEPAEDPDNVLPMDDAAKHRMDFLRIRDTDGRIFTVCLDCGKREYEAAR